MQMGMVGLGRMGGNMAQRLRRAGHQVLGYERKPGKRDVDSYVELVERLDPPRIVWTMVPAGDPTAASPTSTRACPAASGASRAAMAS